MNHDTAVNNYHLDNALKAPTTSITMFGRFGDKNIEYSLQDQQLYIQMLLAKILQEERKKFKMSKVTVGKDHDLGITVKQRKQKLSEFVCMIPGGMGDRVREVERGE